MIVGSVILQCLVPRTWCWLLLTWWIYIVTNKKMKCCSLSIQRKTTKGAWVRGRTVFNFGAIRRSRSASTIKNSKRVRNTGLPGHLIWAKLEGIIPCCFKSIQLGQWIRIQKEGRIQEGSKRLRKIQEGRKKHLRRDHATSGSSGNNLLPTSRSASRSSLGSPAAGEKKDW